MKEEPGGIGGMRAALVHRWGVMEAAGDIEMAS